MAAAPPILLIAGPTAGGKTDLAVALAAALGGECICADSMQVYRGMDIGTAKPTPEQRRAVPHHLLDLLDPSEDGFSVDAWLRLAEGAIGSIRSRGARPIVVGGTNLYVQALLEGMLHGPPPDRALRAELLARPPEELRRRLEAADPGAASRIHPNDLRRSIRAIEVFELTGRRLSDLQTQWGRHGREDVVIVVLEYGVEAINARINARVRHMAARGLVEEVRRLAAAPGGLGRQAGEGLGYRQVLDHLAGRMGLEEALERVRIGTRRLAKQQRTWLRRFRMHPRAVRVAAGGLSPDDLSERVLERLS
jgi:tRNA dimethylallyltransferase